MREKTARRFLNRNAWKIAKRNMDWQFSANSFDQRVVKAKQALGIKRSVRELLWKKF